MTTIQEPNGIQTTYTYDRAGNRQTQTVQGTGLQTDIYYTYDSRNRLLETSEVRNEETTTNTYTYDDNGNQVQVTTQLPNGISQNASYEYNEHNQLIESLSATGQTVTYTYNGDGLRVAKSSNGDTTNYLYSGTNVLAEIDHLGNIHLRGLVNMENNLRFLKPNSKVAMKLEQILRKKNKERKANRVKTNLKKKN